MRLTAPCPRTTMFRLLATLLPFAILAMGAGSPQSTSDDIVVNGAWSMQGSDASHSARVANLWNNSVVSNGKIGWQTPLNCEKYSTVQTGGAVFDATFVAYVVDACHGVTAIQRGGKILRRTVVPITGIRTTSPPIVDAAGNVYVTGTAYSDSAGATGYLVALNRAGSVRWQAAFDWLPNDPILAKDGSILVGCSVLYGSMLFSYSPTGEQRWNASTGVNSLSSNLVLSPIDGTIYAIACVNPPMQTLVMLAMSPTGHVLWKTGVNGGPGGNLMASNVTGDVIFISTASDYTVYSICANGTLRWQFDAGAMTRYVASSAIAADGTVYAAILGQLYALDAYTGQPRWTANVAGQWPVPVAIAIGSGGMIHLIICFDDPTVPDSVYAFSSTGKLVWSQGSLAMCGNGLAVAADSSVYAVMYNATTGVNKTVVNFVAPTGH